MAQRRAHHGPRRGGDDDHDVARPRAAQAAPRGQVGLGPVGGAQQHERDQRQGRPGHREQHAQRHRGDPGGQAEEAESRRPEVGLAPAAPAWAAAAGDGAWRGAAEGTTGGSRSATSRAAWAGER